MTEQVGSIEWIEKCNLLLGRLPEIEQEQPIDNFYMGINLLGEPEELSFSLAVGPKGARLERGINDNCKVWVKLEGGVARQLHGGILPVSEAISQGTIKISGDIDTLVNASSHLSTLSSALAAICSSSNEIDRSH